MNQEKRMDYAIVAQVAMDWAMDESTADCLEHPLKDSAQAIRDLLEKNSSLGAELAAEEKLRADQMAEQHRMECNMRKEIEEENQQLRGQYDAAASVVAELQAQLSAIGAGGVESLRKRQCLHQIAELAPTGEKVYAALPDPVGCIEYPAQPYESAWVSTQEGYDETQMRAFADATATLRGNPPAPAAVAVPAPAHDCCNSWFVSLPEGRQAALRDDKWMLAHAAFDAGRAALAAAPAQALPTRSHTNLPVMWVKPETLEELAYCNGMTIWAESGTAHADAWVTGTGGSSADGLVPLVIAQKHATQLAGQGLTDERISELIQSAEDNSMYGRDHNGWLHSVARAVESELKAAQAIGVPAGFARVPLTINTEMAEAWERAPIPNVDGMNDEEASLACAQANWSAMVAAAPAQAQEDARDALTLDELDQLDRAIEHFVEGEDTDVDWRLLTRAASLGYLECERFTVPPTARAAIDAARAAQGGAA